MVERKERYRTASEPMIILLLFIGVIILSMYGIVDPVIFGIVGTVVVFLLFIEPYLYQKGIVKGAEQRFLYSLLVICIGLLLYGGISKGVIPVMSITGNIVLDTLISLSIYDIVIIVILALIVFYLFRDELKKYF